MIIGKNIRKIRSEKGWSGKQLSEISGVSASYLSQIENGEREPSEDVLRKLANALSVSITSLLNVVESRPTPVLDEDYHEEHKRKQRIKMLERHNDILIELGDSLHLAINLRVYSENGRRSSNVRRGSFKTPVTEFIETTIIDFLYDNKDILNEKIKHEISRLNGIDLFD